MRSTAIDGKRIGGGVRCARSQPLTASRSLELDLARGTVAAMAARSFALTPGKRVLYLTKDPEKIRQQLAGALTLTMNDVSPADLLDDINTDAMTPAWVCFDYDPAEIAKNAYAGLVVGGVPLIPANALRDGGFEVIVAGAQKGVGSSRETAAQCEVFSGSRLAIASSFAPIHARNNINIGQLMGDHAVLRRLEQGESIPLAEFTAGHDAITALIIESGGLLPFCARLARGEVTVPATGTAARPMNLTEKILAAKLLPGQGSYVKPGDAVLVRVDAGYSHEFTTAQVDKFLADEYGAGYALKDPARFAVFEDHLIYATGVAAMAKFAGKIEELRDRQRRFAAATGVRNFSAVDGVSPGICHQVAREQLIDPGDFVQATDSHTCMGGASGALAWGVGATEYAALIYWGFTPIAVPESIRFELSGALPPGTTAKDVMLHILATYARREDTLNRVMEFGGDGLFGLSPDERATLANMATECSARGAVMEADAAMLGWIADRRGGDRAQTIAALRGKCVRPDAGAEYAGGVHRIDLAAIRPMVATPGDPDRGIASDPKNGAYVPEIGEVAIDIAYGGSCTAGKRDDIDMYARVMAEAERAGQRVAEGVRFFIQFGSQEVEAYARDQGYTELFERTGVAVIKPGCGACIGCGPGVSDRGDQVTVSAINRNYKGRSGPGRLYLASPLTVAASAVTGRIVEYQHGMFAPRGGREA
jgi:3-isopropylmalate/(R)-2-methylmalate dehydratase large subunit